MNQLINHIFLSHNHDLMQKIPDSVIDAVVTDPPYGWKFMGKKWDYSIPSVQTFKNMYRILKPGAYMAVCCGTRTQHRMACNIEDAGFEIRDIIAWVYGSGFPKSFDVAKAFEKKKNPLSVNFKGWGTALKPAMELFTLARKPISGTILENLAAYRTSALNIDACRIGNMLREYKGMSAKKPALGVFRDDNWIPKQISVTAVGRFPANIIHDGSPEVLKLFPDDAGAYAPVKSGMSGKSKGIYRDFAQKGDNGNSFYGDSGSAARFFYCAKATEHERNEGLPLSFINTHPTVKPVALMRYITRLITPPGGIVLDPYVGSGSTVIASFIEGFNFIACDNDQQSFNIATQRVAAHRNKPSLFTLQM